MTNNERFNAMLNSCQHPRAVYNALYALAPAISEARSAFTDRLVGKTDREIISSIATVDQRIRAQAEVRDGD